MKTLLTSNPHSSRSGFTLVEFLVAVSIFVILGGAAIALFRQHMPLYSRSQDLSNLNVQVRSAVSQLQLDLANAGTGVYPGANVASWPIGITLVNKISGTNCYDADTLTYTADCFDDLNIIAADPDVPPVHPRDIGSTCVSTTASAAYATPAAGLTLAQTAANYASGDVLLFVKGDGSQMTVATMTAPGQVSGAFVLLQHTPTGANGVNPGDPYGITNVQNTKLGDTFCDNDWVFKLTPIRYRVDTTDTTNPKLVRLRGNESDVVAEQIVGFKIGVTLWNGLTASTAEYNFDAESYGFDFTLIRSVRVSLISRTRPNWEPGFTFRNEFDGGPYHIQGMATVVSPRNLSMND